MRVTVMTETYCAGRVRDWCLSFEYLAFARRTTTIPSFFVPIGNAGLERFIKL